MNRLLDIGFDQSGHWKLVGEEPHKQLQFELIRNTSNKDILYAFVCDSEVMYVGKTVQTLAARMSGYKNPGNTQTTNIRNNRHIKEQLTKGAAVEIFALPDNGLMHYGGFHLNLAAALEDDIIRKLNPPWNGGRVEKISKANTKVSESIQQVSLPMRTNFSFILHNAYYVSGFFNIGVNNQNLIGANGEQIELFLGKSEHPILGTINRTANNNRTPRIMGGSRLRDWFHAIPNIVENIGMQQIDVQVYSPTSIRLVIGLLPKKL